MKRVFALLLGIVLCGASAAQADTYSDYTRTASSVSGYDLVTVYLTSLPSGVASLSGIEGTLTSTEGSFLLSSSSVAGTWKSAATEAGDSQSLSYVNFSSYVSMSRVGSGSNYTSLTGTWYSTPGDSTNCLTTLATDTDGDGVNENVVAKVYVTTGSDLTFSGNVNTVNTAGGGSTFAFSASAPAVPEPSTLILLGCGSFGLIAYAWRKRKLTR